MLHDAYTPSDLLCVREFKQYSSPYWIILLGIASKYCRLILMYDLSNATFHCGRYVDGNLTRASMQLFNQNAHQVSISMTYRKFGNYIFCQTGWDWLNLNGLVSQRQGSSLIIMLALNTSNVVGAIKTTRTASFCYVRRSQLTFSKLNIFVRWCSKCNFSWETSGYNFCTFSTSNNRRSEPLTLLASFGMQEAPPEHKCTEALIAVVSGFRV